MRSSHNEMNETNSENNKGAGQDLLHLHVLRLEHTGARLFRYDLKQVYPSLSLGQAPFARLLHRLETHPCNFPS